MMNSIKQIREALQLNQEDVAIYLGITRSLLSLAEINKRELPTPALLKLTILHQSLPQNIAAENLPLVAAELAAEKNELNDFLKQLAIKNLQQALHLQKKLIAMQNNYATALKLLQVIRTIKNNLPNTAKKDLLWCNAIEAATKERLQKNNLVAQKKVEMEIEKYG